MIIRHNKCSSPVYVDISEGIIFLVSVGVTKEYLKPSSGDIRLRSSVINSKFYCSNCEEKVENKNIIVKCQFCGKDFSLSDIYTLSKSSGAYCDRCANDFFQDERKTKLEKVYEKISLV